MLTKLNRTKFTSTILLQWKPDITMYQGTGEITSLYRGIVKPGFRSIHFTVTGIGRAVVKPGFRSIHFTVTGIGRAEKC